tara:strand:+ start:1017 stop:3617 length:2601 start_codon:yes stop_codon:yes gene_type:complete
VGGKVYDQLLLLCSARHDEKNKILLRKLVETNKNISKVFRQAALNVLSFKQTSSSQAPLSQTPLMKDMETLKKYVVKLDKLEKYVEKLGIELESFTKQTLGKIHDINVLLEAQNVDKKKIYDQMNELRKDVVRITTTYTPTPVSPSPVPSVPPPPPVPPPPVPPPPVPPPPVPSVPPPPPVPPSAPEHSHIIDNGDKLAGFVDEDELNDLKQGEISRMSDIHFSFLKHLSSYKKSLESILKIFKKVNIALDYEYNQLQDAIYRKSKKLSFSKAAKYILSCLMMIWSSLILRTSHLLAFLGGPCVYLPFIGLDGLLLIMKTAMKINPVAIPISMFISQLPLPRVKKLTHGFFWTVRYMYFVHKSRFSDIKGFGDIFSCKIMEHIVSIFNTKISENMSRDALLSTFSPDPKAWVELFEPVYKEYYIYFERLPHDYNNLKLKTFFPYLDTTSDANVSVSSTGVIENFPPILEGEDSFKGLVAVVDNVFPKSKNNEMFLAALKEPEMSMQIALIDTWFQDANALEKIDVDASYKALILYLKGVQNAAETLIKNLQESILYKLLDLTTTRIAMDIQNAATFLLDKANAYAVYIYNFATPCVTYIMKPVFMIMNEVYMHIGDPINAISKDYTNLKNLVTSSPIVDFFTKTFAQNNSLLLEGPDFSGDKLSYGSYQVQVVSNTWLTDVWSEIQTSARKFIPWRNRAYSKIKTDVPISLNEVLDIRMNAALVRGDEREYKWCYGMKIIGPNITELARRNETNQGQKLDNTNPHPIFVTDDELKAIQNAWKRAYDNKKQEWLTDVKWSLPDFSKMGKDVYQVSIGSQIISSMQNFYNYLPLGPAISAYGSPMLARAEWPSLEKSEKIKSLKIHKQ